MNEVIFDIETQNTFQDVGARDTDLLKISVVGVYTYRDDQYRIYTEEELPKLWPILEHADRLIGYAIDRFDIPVLQNYYSGDLKKFPTLDMLEEVSRILGHRLKMDAIARGSLGYGKSGHGLDAVAYWRAGELEKLKQYCLDDVRITRELYEYGKKNKQFLYREDFGGMKKVPVNFASVIARTNVNLTLGF